jgi:hypothetical protein
MKEVTEKLCLAQESKQPSLTPTLLKVSTKLICYIFNPIQAIQLAQ